jgi:hypothetical protein
MKRINDGTEKTRSHWYQDMLGGRPVILVDFHHTITKICEACPDYCGEYILQDGVREALEKLHKNFDIFIFTGIVDAEFMDGYHKLKVINFLKENKIPYDGIYFNKPIACFIIDDRAIHHEGWVGEKSTLRKIKRRMEK